MDWLTFISKLIEFLVWPAASVALVVILREHIRALIPSIKRVKAGPIEADFEREVKELKEATPAAHATLTDRRPDTASKAFLMQVAELHPRSAILESWVRVEAAARVVLARKNVTTPTSAYIPAARLAEPLAEQNVLSQSQVTLFHELRRLRNEVAHLQGLEPTLEAARAYIDLATFFQGWLEGHAQ